MQELAQIPLRYCSKSMAPKSTQKAQKGAGSSYTIAVPTYQRPKEFYEKTYTCVLKPLGLAASTIVFIQTDEDEMAYRKQLRGTKIRTERAPKGFAEVNHYIEHFFDVGARVVVMHDDLKGILKLGEKNGKPAFQKLESHQEADSLLHTAFEAMEAKGLSLGGVNSTQNAFFAKGCKDAVSYDRKFIWDPLHFIISTKATVKCKHFYFDDFERTFEAYKRDGGVLRMNYYAIDSANEPFSPKASGGLAGQRTREGAAKAAEALKAEYPDYIAKFSFHKSGSPKFDIKRLPARRAAAAPSRGKPSAEAPVPENSLEAEAGATPESPESLETPETPENTAQPFMSDSGYSIRPCAVMTLHQHTKKPSEPLTEVFTDPKDAILPQNSKWLILDYGDAVGSTKTLHEKTQQACGGLDLFVSVANVEGRMYVLLYKSSQRTVKTFPPGYTLAFGIKLPGGGPRDRAATVSFVRTWFDVAYECTTTLEVTLDDTDAVVQEAMERTSHMDKGQFARHIARLKMKPANDRDALEQTTVRCRPELRVIRREEELLQLAKHVVHFIGQNSIDRAFPEDFQHTDVLSDPWEDPDTGEVKQVSLLEFFEGDYHLRCTTVLLGPKSLNKTQLAEAMAAKFAKRYSEQRYYIKVSTMSAVKKVQSYMREGVPVIFEEFATSDRQQQRAAFSADYLKNFANVEGGGQCRAPGSDVSFAPYQPRTVCYNGTKEEWLPLLGKTTEMHRGAMEKRLMFFNIRERMVREELVQDHAAKRKDFVERGKKRAGECLGECLDEPQGKRARTAC